VVAKVGWHPGEVYPRVGLIVTNLAQPAERVMAFHNRRGTAETCIKEGKSALKWTRRSCRSFAANAVRLQLHALAYNLGNFMRTLAIPSGAVVADQSAREADQDRRQGGQPRSLRHFPVSRSRRATADVPGDPDADHPVAHTACPSMTGLWARKARITMGEARLDEGKPAVVTPARQATHSSGGAWHQ
jgi:hypothetical protein